MNTDPVIYDKDHPLMRPSLCQGCIEKQKGAMLLTGSYGFPTWVWTYYIKEVK
jgi:hypothetical protein